ncbi:MAG: hypothetical protein NWF04_10705 [Candidatus Bathyarchaeota archaeon]|nr:hypothetical protein [Candidatus Bathyarchaeota archaeon]
MKSCLFVFVALMVASLIASTSFGVANSSDESLVISALPATGISPSIDTTYTDDFSTDSSLWTIYGSAYRDDGNETLVLTEPLGDQGGAAFFKLPFTNSFTANFSYKVGGGSGGDGFTMFFYKQLHLDIGNGEALGFSKKHNETCGYAIEFDSHQNIGYSEPSPPNEHGDPSADHVALIKNFVGNHLVYVNESRVDDDTWHDVCVVVGDSYVGVFLDGEFIFRWDGTFNKTYDCFGFSAATGGATNWHIIDNFHLTPTVVEPPLIPTRPTASNATRFPSVISIAAEASSSQVGSTVNIHGAISDENSIALNANETVILSYAVGDNESWFPLGSGQTNALGEYNIQWIPSASGTFMLKTHWDGNLNYTGASNTTTLSFLPYQNQQVFCVESNSTITGLNFDNDNLTLSFTVTGPTGTTGYTKAAIAKTLAPNINGVTTSIDGKTTNFTTASTNENWILSFNYTHSTHQININIPPPTPETTTPTPGTQLPLWAIPSALVVAVLIAATTIIIKKHKNPPTPLSCNSLDAVKKRSSLQVK